MSDLEQTSSKEVTNVALRFSLLIYISDKITKKIHYKFGACKKSNLL